MKRYLIAKDLRVDTDVKKVVQLDRSRTLSEFLAIAKTYIRYEELYADNLNKSRKKESAAESSKSPSKKRGRKANLSVKAKDQSVASRYTHHWPCPAV